jgi:hypothetical protein
MLHTTAKKGAIFSLSQRRENAVGAPSCVFL